MWRPLAEFLIKFLLPIYVELRDNIESLNCTSFERKILSIAIFKVEALQVQVKFYFLLQFVYGYFRLSCFKGLISLFDKQGF